jgi:hypothetical protein
MSNIAIDYFFYQIHSVVVRRYTLYLIIYKLVFLLSFVKTISITISNSEAVYNLMSSKCSDELSSQRKISMIIVTLLETM